MKHLLEIHDLHLVAHTAEGSHTIVDRLELSVQEGESLALVGESGSGKSITALSVLGLLPEQEVTVEGGRIEFAGQNLVSMSRRERRRVAGSGIAMIFQEPMASLNPVMRIGDQIVEMIQAHESVSKKAAMSRATELLAAVRMPEPEMRLRAYPHQLSGGQRQRVMIAIALACRPRLLMADEPTTALDVTVQAYILTLLRELQQDMNMAMLFITHDLGVVANIADRVAIMYCGRIAETAPVVDLFQSPAHPYTRGLLACIPTAQGDGKELTTIPGQMPTSTDPVLACRFAPRCPIATSACIDIIPPEVDLSPVHKAHCHQVTSGVTA